jgi:hypothetical protein
MFAAVPLQSLQLCLPKKEAAAPPPPACQQQHQSENIYKPKRIGLILPYLQYKKCVILVEGMSNYQVVRGKISKTFCAIYILLDESLYIFGRW